MRPSIMYLLLLLTCGSRCEAADVIVVSGGNTLYAMDLWSRSGLSPLLLAAADRGAVLTGGSAGAICWFDGGHSDSADPDTYKDAMLQTVLKIGQDESSSLGEGGVAKQWEYIRVPCLGIFPGLVCPHADSVQSNGVLRMTDFDAMMLRHGGERGICIDHFAALIVEDSHYRVLSLPGRPGSVMPDGSWSIAREGVPGAWQKDVVEGNLVTQLIASTGTIASLFKVADDITPDPHLEQCRLNNPLGA
jgi:dipeptidase E